MNQCVRLEVRILFVGYLLVFLTAPFLALAQTGPGGVGSDDGSSSLEFWYMAQDEPYVDLDLVNSVSDRSGNGRSLSASGGERPTFTEVTASANDMPSMLFSLNQELETSYVGNSNENMSFGMVMSYSSNGGLNVSIQHGGRNTFGVSSANRYTDFVGGSNHTSGTSATSAWTYHAKTFANSGTNRLRYYVNNTNTDNFDHNIENRTSNTWIGGHGSGGGTGFNGGIAEVFKFSRVLNSAENTIIANYLAAKYAITLSSADVYDEDELSNGDFDFDVAGIGQASDGSNHTDSRGTGILRVSNATDLDDNEYFVWGHDNGDFQAIETADVPAGVDARFDRVWRGSEVNASGSVVDIGSVDLEWDLTGLGAISTSDLRLLIDTDNDGNFNDETPISGASSLGSNIYEFSAISGLEDNLRFTLGTANSTQTPLPIELIRFDAHYEVRQNQVQLFWETASEVNNDFFTVEKSSDLLDWKNVDIIKGAGFSSTLNSYSTYDLSPENPQVFYRLKQTDFDGGFEYSESVLVRTTSYKSDKISLYPNPVLDRLYLTCSVAFSTEELRLVNVMGEELSGQLFLAHQTDNQLTLDVSSLSQGLFIVEVNGQKLKFFKL